MYMTFCRHYKFLGRGDRVKKNLLSTISQTFRIDVSIKKSVHRDTLLYIVVPTLLHHKIPIASFSFM